MTRPRDRNRYGATKQQQMDFAQLKKRAPELVSLRTHFFLDDLNRQCIVFREFENTRTRERGQMVDQVDPKTMAPMPDQDEKLIKLVSQSLPPAWWKGACS